jgi:ubiquinone/menaquinone biosynthesis C-methylase UbiE
VKKVLHVGCGAYAPDKLPEIFNTSEWQELRLDINPAVRPDITASITNMDKIGDNEFDALYSSHNLEHLHPHEVAPALKEFYRVLRPAGFVMIALPDLQQAAEYIARGQEEETVLMTNKGPITPLDLLYGFRPFLSAGNLFMAHNFAFTAATLKKALQAARFSGINVERDGKFNLWAVASKL